MRPWKPVAECCGELADTDELTACGHGASNVPRSIPDRDDAIESRAGLGHGFARLPPSAAATRTTRIVALSDTARYRHVDG